MTQSRAGRRRATTFAVAVGLLLLLGAGGRRAQAQHASGAQVSGTLLRPAPPSLLAAQDNEDFLKLSLEELMEVEITPVNVLGSHTHLKGERMFGYRYMHVDMGRNREGTRDIGVADVLEHYPVAHTTMRMEMHMVDLMYAPSDRLSLMVMAPYMRMSMGHLNRAGVRYTTRSEGIGDTMLMGLYTFRGNPRQQGSSRFIFNAGLSVPTGSIDERDRTPSNPRTKLEYQMQLGSGTFDLLPGVTYLGESKNWAWGAQALQTVRLGKNKNHYQLGNERRLSGWGYYKVSDWFGPSLRLNYVQRDNISGEDPEMDEDVNSAFDPHQQALKRLDLFVGANLYAPRGGLKGQRVSIEWGYPMYQSVAGMQMGTYSQVTVAWSLTLR